jgi:DNA end-binding protein Ku
MPTDTVGQEAFAVIRDAMRGKGMVALGRIVLAKRERVIALEPYGKGLLGTTLRYAYEVRKADEYFDGIQDIKVPGEMLKLAEHILDTKKGDFEPAAFEDHYENALIELMRKKQAGFTLPKQKEQATAPRNVINLMDALRRSVEAERGAAPAPAQGKKGRKRAEGQREMLLPIEGGERAPARATASKKSGARRKAG